MPGARELAWGLGPCRALASRPGRPARTPAPAPVRYLAVRRRILVDLGPLRHSRDFGLLFSGQLVSTLGTQLTVVAVPYQVYRLTGSSLDVGLVSLVQLGPLLVCSLIGGSVADTHDRRRVLMVTELLMALCSAGLALNGSLA